MATKAGSPAPRKKAAKKTAQSGSPARRPRRPRGLTVAVTGPTGTFGSGLLPLLEADDRVARVVGVARRPFDPAARGWTKMTYRRGDVREPDVLREAFSGADVVVHLAFLITGAASRRTIREINVDGTLNAFRAARESGVRRFVYASSVAAYGFHPDNPARLTEDWPVRPAARLFYAQEKAELEQLLTEEAARDPDTELYLLRPSIVVGPNVVGSKNAVPVLGRLLPSRPRRLPFPVPVAVPTLTMQLVHEADVGQALLLCAVGSGPPGAYNIAADGIVTAVDVAREFGAWPIPLPPGPARTIARAVSAVPFLPPFAQWVEAASRPAIMDTSRAKQLLGWAPGYTGIEALRSVVHPEETLT
jgi:nucleoside-diphosphate-sugar epimerase